MNLNQLEVHPLAEQFPLLPEEEAANLAKDLREKGLIERITLFEGKILDGRNRYNASKVAGMILGPEDVELFEEAYPHDDPADFVFSKNILRRHLTVGQRADLARAHYKRMAKGDGNAKERMAKVAKQAGVSTISVEQAAHVEKIAPDIAKDVRAGRKTLHKAVKEAAKRGAGDSHDQAMLKVAEVCGKPFANAVKDEQIPALSTAKHLIAFAELPEKTMVAVAPSLRLGWKMNRALSFVDKEVTPATTMSQVIDLWAFKGQKRYEFELDGVKIVLSKAQGKDGQNGE